MTHIQLYFLSGIYRTKTYDVPPTGVILGRSSSCDLSIQDAILSRQHCRIYSEGDQVYLCDLNSANGTTLNGHDIDTTPQRLKDGDIVGLGESLFSVTIKGAQGSSPLEAPPAAPAPLQATANPLQWSETSDPDLVAAAAPLTPQPMATPQPAPAKQEDLSDVLDLGLNTPLVDDAAAPATQGSGKKFLRLLIVALLLLITTFGGLIFYEKFTQASVAKAKALANERVEPLQDARTAPFDVTYEHLLISPQSVFSYRLTFASATGLLILRSESIGDGDRSFEEQKALSEQEIVRLREVFINHHYERIPEQYPEQTTTPCTFDRKHLHIALGRNLWARTSENYASNDYEKLCLALESCAGDLLNLKAAQYSIAELLDFARGHLDDAEAYWLRIAQGDDNLCKSYENYREAEAYLRTINPKPDFAKEIQRGIDKTSALMDERYNDYKLTVDQAYHGRDEALEARALSRIMRLLPAADERYRQAEMRLEILEGKRHH
jgi:pSer/pThr/pTyr-binding forkhead associated (FHA) protein